MSWVISLILLAVAAYFLISALKGKNQYDVKNQASDGEINESESAQLSSGATSGDAFQNAGGAPTGASSDSTSGTSASSGSADSGSGGAASAPSAGSAGSGSGTAAPASTGGSSIAAGVAAAGATTTAATVAAAIASAREHNLKGVTGNSVGEIQEMLKILNLRDSDAGRLAIDKDQFAALKSDTSKLGANELTAVADKLRWMLR